LNGDTDLKFTPNYILAALGIYEFSRINIYDSIFQFPGFISYWAEDT